MFSRKEQLIERTGAAGIGRFDYLKLLIAEYKTTKSKAAKEQVLANLANFAYDPINYDYFRRLQGIDVFLFALSDDNQVLVEFAIQGLCNICLDPHNKEYILRNHGVQLISSLLSSQNEEIVLSALTTLMFLITAESKAAITSPEIVQCVTEFSNSGNKRIKNLALVFINDYCKEKETTDKK